MTRYEMPTGERLALAERLFSALQTLRALAAEDSEPPVTFSRLVGYVDSAEAADEALSAALAHDARLRADLHLLIARSALARLPRPSAAAAGAISERHGDGCRIRLEASRAEPDQMFVIIEIADREARPARLFVVDDDHHCRAFPLPAARDGLIQVLAEVESDLVRGLQDLATEVFLR